MVASRASRNAVADRTPMRDVPTLPTRSAVADEDRLPSLADQQPQRWIPERCSRVDPRPAAAVATADAQHTRLDPQLMLHIPKARRACAPATPATEGMPSNGQGAPPRGKRQPGRGHTSSQTATDATLLLPESHSTETLRRRLPPPVGPSPSYSTVSTATTANGRPWQAVAVGNHRPRASSTPNSQDAGTTQSVVPEPFKRPPRRRVTGTVSSASPPDSLGPRPQQGAATATTAARPRALASDTIPFVHTHMPWMPSKAPPTSSLSVAAMHETIGQQLHQQPHAAGQRTPFEGKAAGAVHALMDLEGWVSAVRHPPGTSPSAAAALHLPGLSTASKPWSTTRPHGSEFGRPVVRPLPSLVSQALLLTPPSHSTGPQNHPPGSRVPYAAAALTVDQADGALRCGGGPGISRAVAALTRGSIDTSIDTTVQTTPRTTSQSHYHRQGTISAAMWQDLPQHPVNPSSVSASTAPARTATSIASITASTSIGGHLPATTTTTTTTVGHRPHASLACAEESWSTNTTTTSVPAVGHRPHASLASTEPPLCNPTGGGGHHAKPRVGHRAHASVVGADEGFPVEQVRHPDPQGRVDPFRWLASAAAMTTAPPGDTTRRHAEPGHPTSSPAASAMSLTTTEAPSTAPRAAAAARALAPTPHRSTAAPPHLPEQQTSQTSQTSSRRRRCPVGASAASRECSTGAFGHGSAPREAWSDARETKATQRARDSWARSSPAADALGSMSSGGRSRQLFS